MELNILHEYAETIVVVGGALTALGYGLKRIYKAAKNIDTVTTYVNQRQAIDIKNDKLLNDIAAQLKPNGGESLRDTINEIKERVSVIEQWKHDNGA